MCYLQTNDHSSCYGCKACVNACTHGAIEMIEDEEGFLYPHIIEERCISCGLCRKVCPYDFQVNKTIYVSASCLVHKESGVVYSSSSGGAFTAITQAVFERHEDCVVFGVAWDPHLHAVMKSAKTIEEVKEFQKSKYVQCDTRDCYVQVRNYLKEGRYVVFSGTPCQNAAMISFLQGKKPDNLLLIDIICHGVPNQKIFDQYIREKEAVIGKIRKYEFRNKSPYGGKVDSTTAKLTTEEKEYIYSIEEDAYLNAYYKRLNYRPSCKTCQYAQIERVSDITIGDAWKIERLYPDIDPNVGASIVLANTKKGQDVVDLLTTHEKRPVSEEYLMCSNEALVRPTVFHKNRDKFFKLLKKSKNFTESSFRATKPTIFKEILYRVISPRNRARIKKLLGFGG